MKSLVRFGVSLQRGLLAPFDKRLRSKGYATRSEAIRDLIREELVRSEWEDEPAVAAGAILLIYDHHQRTLLEKITDAQHEAQGKIISTQHIHLDHHHCLEIIAVRGPARELKGLADRLRSLKGVKHGNLSLTSTGRHLV